MLAEWPGASYLTSLCFHCLICKGKMKLPTPQGSSEDRHQCLVRAWHGPDATFSTTSSLVPDLGGGFLGPLQVHTYPWLCNDHPVVVTTPQHTRAHALLCAPGGKMGVGQDSSWPRVDGQHWMKACTDVRRPTLRLGFKRR